MTKRMNEGRADWWFKKVSVVAGKGSEPSNRAFWKFNGYTIYNGKVSAQKKDGEIVFPYPLRPISNLSTCPSSPGAREPVSVGILSNLLRKRRVIMKDVNVSHGKPKMDKMVKRRVTLCSSFTVVL
jgi:hypothetical protein